MVSVPLFGLVGEREWPLALTLWFPVEGGPGNLEFGREDPKGVMEDDVLPDGTKIKAG
ncbi:hypothetical protein A2U01_0044368, partial [Trifolium medium]|nr:hypothetical protein [Trifolium medium]